ncbi:TetR/AcrR family transcriptional regulator [Streptomyces sp. NPDC051217]|uniref:TetR/AcrR family transcriptional regulator n=1 Tax=Streptomyces sp. NPDC051217 TaxID=3365644 RepID=UPI0037B1E42F
MSSANSSAAGGPRSGSRRPTLSRGDRQESALLDSVEALLVTKPLERITIADVAQHTGLSRPAVYFYFASKDALAETAIARTVDGLIAAVEERAAKVPDESLDVCIDDLLTIGLAMWRRSSPLLIAAVDLLGRRPALREIWQAYMNRCAAIVASAVERDRDRGVLPRNGDALAIATAACWMFERNCYMLFMREHTRSDEDELMATIAMIFRRSLGAEDPCPA